MSDATGAIVGLLALSASGVLQKFLPDKPIVKAVGKTGWEALTKPRVFMEGEITPPSSEAGIRPTCAVGEHAKFNEHTDTWVCVPSSWD